MEANKTKLIPLRNRDGEIIDHAIVSEEDFEHLNSFKWHKTTKEYVDNLFVISAKYSKILQF